MNGSSASRVVQRLGGGSLVVAAVAFVSIFSYLAARFDYPGVLDGRAADVLPRLLALGEVGRGVWVLYSLMPLLLIPGGIAAYALLKESAPNAVRLALVASVMAAVSMLLGLARWPSVHWELARAYGAAGNDARQAMDAVFVGLNAYLGNFVGEFLGELALNVFFISVGIASLRSAQVGRWFPYSGIGVGVIGLVAALRNATAMVDAVATVNNYLLPLWLIVLGVTLMRWRTALPESGTLVPRPA